jgi:hypothetical protein
MVEMTVHELIAKAIHESDGMPKFIAETYSIAALRALESAGFVIVPRKATEAMRMAVGVCWEHYEQNGIAWDAMVEEASGAMHSMSRYPNPR